jgi:hypothetical protein
MAAQVVQIPFTTPNAGNFTLPQSLGVVPGSVIFEMTSGGAVYFQPARFDANNLYLVASAAGLTGYAIVFAASSPSFLIPGQANSTIQLQEVVDDASTLGDVAPALSTGGSSRDPALSIANDVMQAMINGGPGGQPYNWKWNRYNLPVFYTNSLQQDYFIPNLVNIGWLESGWAVDINQTSIPKQSYPVEIDKDLLVMNNQSGYIGKAAWLPNSVLNTGTWGAQPLGPTAGNPSGQTTLPGPNLTGQQNPGPNVLYTNPLGQLVTPYNATTAIKDPNGNLWCLTTYGVCGATQPTWPTSPVYPTLRNPNLIATTVTDGTCVWTAINPYGQGIRLSPMPPQSGIIWAIQLVGQMVAPRFFRLSQYLNPLPDTMEWAFKQGFFAECYRRNADPKIRARYKEERQNWLEALDKAVRQYDREKDDFGFYPGSPGVMDTGWGFNMVTPSMPYGPWVGW